MKIIRNLVLFGTVVLCQLSSDTGGITYTLNYQDSNKKIQNMTVNNQSSYIAFFELRDSGTGEQVYYKEYAPNQETVDVPQGNIFWNHNKHQNISQFSMLCGAL